MDPVAAADQLLREGLRHRHGADPGDRQPVHLPGRASWRSRSSRSPGDGYATGAPDSSRSRCSGSTSRGSCQSGRRFFFYVLPLTPFMVLMVTYLLPRSIRRHDRRARARHRGGRAASRHGRAGDLDGARLSPVRRGLRDRRSHRVLVVLADPDRRSHHAICTCAPSCGSEPGSDRVGFAVAWLDANRPGSRCPTASSCRQPCSSPTRVTARGRPCWKRFRTARTTSTSSVAPTYYGTLADAGYVMCWLDVRGTGSSGGIATDEYTAAERRDLVDGDRLARDPTVVRGHGRDVRHQLRRLQLAAGGDRTAARTQGDRADLRVR